MNDLLSKLTSYNLFNYLVPGVVFAIAAEGMLDYQIAKRDVVTGAFFCYFLGLVVSRFGSLVVEPVLKWSAIVKFAEYRDFVAASKIDPKLEVLSEVNNTYRTFCSLFSLLLLLRLYLKIAERFAQIKPWNGTLLAVALLVMFLLSYRKQTSYITKRIKANLGEPPTRGARKPTADTNA
jgi:hypothetical protein